LTKPAALTILFRECKPIDYPATKPPLTTDLLTSLALTDTNHAENQLVHLQLPPGSEARRHHVEVNVGEYAGLLGRACPAAVYEYVHADETQPAKRVEDEGWKGKKLVINSQVSNPLFSEIQ
jgi:electron-transferring-flavoprotein dehydrogenase